LANNPEHETIESLSSFLMNPVVDKVRTLSDTKREFYNHHTRPINSIFRRVVEELLVEMHLLNVNVDFQYDSIYAFGVVTAYDRFMQAYRPEGDINSIFAAMCQSIGGDPQQYRQDAERIGAIAKNLSADQMMSLLNAQTQVEDTGELSGILSAIATNEKFKYSRLFAIGLYSLLEQANPEAVKNEKQLQTTITKVSEALNLPTEKMLKDLELYQSNLEKMAQARSAIEDALQAGRKQRERRAQEKLEKQAKTEEQDPAPSTEEA
jgi:photosystem II biogenesis protein Psp29